MNKCFCRFICQKYLPLVSFVMADILRLLFVGIQLPPLNMLQHYTFRDQRFLFDLLYITFVIIAHSLQMFGKS